MRGAVHPNLALFSHQIKLTCYFYTVDFLPISIIYTLPMATNTSTEVLFPFFLSKLYRVRLQKGIIAGRGSIDTFRKFQVRKGGIGRHKGGMKAYQRRQASTFLTFHAYFTYLAFFRIFEKIKKNERSAKSRLKEMAQSIKRWHTLVRSWTNL